VCLLLPGTASGLPGFREEFLELGTSSSLLGAGGEQEEIRRPLGCTALWWSTKPLQVKARPRHTAPAASWSPPARSTSVRPRVTTGICNRVADAEGDDVTTTA
jgi:hypothetical protein